LVSNTELANRLDAEVHVQAAARARIRESLTTSPSTRKTLPVAIAGDRQRKAVAAGRARIRKAAGRLLPDAAFDAGFERGELPANRGRSAAVTHLTLTRPARRGSRPVMFTWGASALTDTSCLEPAELEREVDGRRRADRHRDAAPDRCLKSLGARLPLVVAAGMLRIW